jgi:simple sugar transport system permease protein
MKSILSKLSMKTRTATQRRQGRLLIVLLALSLFELKAFGVSNHAHAKTTFGFTLGKEWIIIEKWMIDSRTGCFIFSALALLGSLLGLARVRVKKGPGLGTAIASFSLMMGFLCWAAAGKFIPFTGMLQGSLLLAVPLVFGSMSGLLCERSGVINIAIEGQLLAGAFASGVVASLTHKTMWGLLIAPLAGALISTLLATFAIKFSVDQVILGFVLNVLVIGLTNFLYKKLLIPYQSTWNSGPSFSHIEIPIIGKIPIIGPIFFNQTVIVYLMYIIVATITFSLFRTKWGLRTRAIGEHPSAADSVGIDVNKLRFRNVVIAGLVSGLGGAYFTVGSVGTFGKEMTAGAGFIALAALIFGKWTPMGALSAALLFGFADNLQGTLSIIGVSIPSEFMLMVPYIATIIAVSGLVGRVRAPKADGIHYSRGESH